MRHLDSLKLFLSRTYRTIRSSSLWNQTPPHADTANRSLYLDDVFYLALMGPYI